MKTQILDFIHHLLLMDYLLFGGIFLLFVLLLIIAIFLHHKMSLAIFFVILAFLVVTIGPIVGYTLLHNYLFKYHIKISEMRALEFTEALLIKGDINNTSKRTFNECTIHAGVHKISHNPYLDKIYPFFPFKKESYTINTPIQSGESAKIKMFIEPFRYNKDYNLTIKANCR